MLCHRLLVLSLHQSSLLSSALAAAHTVWPHLPPLASRYTSLPFVLMFTLRHGVQSLSLPPLASVSTRTDATVDIGRFTNLSAYRTGEEPFARPECELMDDLRVPVETGFQRSRRSISTGVTACAPRRHRIEKKSQCARSNMGIFYSD
jgi:hypothetical protein